MENNDWVELKTGKEVFDRHAENWEIQRLNATNPPTWAQWSGATWCSPDCFRGRPRQPKVKEVKMLCYYTSDQLLWIPAELKAQKSWIRQPHLDMIAKVPE